MIMKEVILRILDAEINRLKLNNINNRHVDFPTHANGKKYSVGDLIDEEVRIRQFELIREFFGKFNRIEEQHLQLIWESVKLSLQSEKVVIEDS